MKTLKRAVALVTITSISGCASQQNMPMIFGQSITAGVAIGGSAPEQSGEVTVGITDRSFAVIPVISTTPNGERPAQMIGSIRDGRFDSYSVFGHFSAVERGSVTTPKPKASFGKFFATGIAAINIAEGFEARLSGIKKDEVPSPKLKEAIESAAKSAQSAATSALAASKVAESLKDPSRTAVNAADRAEAAAVAANQSANNSSHSAREAQRLANNTAQAVAAKIGSESTTNKPRVSRLIFAQYDSYGLSLGISTADLGGGLTLGYKSRNVAIIPTVKVDQNGNFYEQLNSKSDNDQDSLSVLGQFESSTTGGVAFENGLNIFFTTGAAAQALSKGFRARLGMEPPTEPKKPESGTTEETGASTASTNKQ